MIRIIKEVVISLILAALMIYAFIGAVMQESFRNCPPTAAELAENPSLERYLP